MLPVRVLLTYPYSWPEVRRGGERLFHDLGVYLRSAGLDVTAVTTRRGPVAPEPGVIRWRALPEIRLPRGITVDRPVSYLPGAALSISRARPQLVHGLFHLDGVAARLARPATGRIPYLVHVQGMPRRENLERLRVHKLLLKASVRRAAAVVAVSRAAADALEEDFGVTAVPVHNGVFTSEYGAARFEDRAAEPTVLFPADPNDPRKRLEVLTAAVSGLDPPWGDCRLEVAGDPAPAVQDSLRAALGERVRFLGNLDSDGMREAYARSWVACLPAVREAFGLVVVESLASGRPCVAVRDGGVPEILGDGPGREWMAEPDDPDSLAGALTAALGAAERPDSVVTCRGIARSFDWSASGPRLLRLYEEVAGPT